MWKNYFIYNFFCKNTKQVNIMNTILTNTDSNIQSEIILCISWKWFQYKPEKFFTTQETEINLDSWLILNLILAKRWLQ